MEGLQRWLNEEVGLSKHISNFEKDFANGYFFGEIFSRFNLQPDFRSFLNFNSTDSKMNNFARLEPPLRLLEIKFPSKTANEIMEEKKGVAARLLLTMKASLEALSEDDKRRAITPTSFPSLSRGSIQQQQDHIPQHPSSHNQSPSLSSSQSTGSPSHRNGIESPGKPGTPKRPFKTFDSADQSRTASPQRLKSAPPLDEEQPPSLQDVKPISFKIDKQKVDLKYQLHVEEKARKKKMKQMAEATNDVLNGIENFEKSLKNFTYDETQHQQTKFSLIKQANGARTRAPPPSAASFAREENENGEDAQKYMQQIKKKKDEDQIARQERDKRRRKILLEQQQAQKLLDDKQNEEMLLEKLLRQSKEERRLAARIVETRNKSKEIRRNRILREEQYAAQRQKDFESLLERDAQLGRAAKLEYELKAKLDRELYEQYEMRRKIAKHNKHYAMCGRIVNCFLAKELREWKTLFKAGVPLCPPKKSKSAITLEKFNYQSYEPEDEADCILDERDFLDYLKGKEDWALVIPESPPPQPSPPPPSSQQQLQPSTTIPAPTTLSISQQASRPHSPVPSPISSRPHSPTIPVTQFDPHILLDVPQNNTHLGELVSRLFSIALPQDPPPPPPCMPSFPVRAAILGKHLAGKSTILQKLSEMYRVTIISVHALVSKAIEETKISESNNELAEIGLQCMHAQLERKEVDDQTLVNLVVREITQISVRSEEENKPASGWVLEGFPATVAQAQLLEKALTGYEAPLSPRGKKTRAKKKETTSKKRVSQIAPALPEELAQAPTNPQSGIDLVIHIDVADDVIIRRAVGRRLDPETGITYHLEYTPPPEHKGVHGRLVPVEEGEATALYQNLSSFKEGLPKLAKWFSRFNNFKVVSGDSPTEEITATLVEFINQIPSPTTEDEEEKEDDTPSGPNLTVEIPNGIESHASLATPALPHKSTSSAAVNVVPTQPELEMAHKPVVELDVELAAILIERFLEMEASYTTTAKSIFCRIRKERRTTLHHLALLRDDFLVFLKRPHSMQEHIQAFQQNFNDVDNDMRGDIETKQELHQRTDDLRDQLWEISDLRKADAEAERKATNEDGWLEARLSILTNTFISLMQLEVDRFVECKRLLKDYSLYIMGCRRLPLDNTQVVYIELPLVGASQAPSLPAPLPSTTDGSPSSKSPSGQHPPGNVPVGPVTLKKKKATDGISGSPSIPSTVPSTPKSGRQVLTSSQNRTRAKKKHSDQTANRYENEPFPDLYIAYCMAQNLVLYSDKRDDTTSSIEGLDVQQQASQLEDKILLSRLERIKDCAVRVLKDTRGQSEKLAAKEEDWLGARFLTEMSAISNLTRVVKDAVEREKKLPYFFKLIDDEFIIEEDLLVFEPELAPPPPVPQERTYVDRFSSDQITALTQRFSLLAPCGLVAVKDCAELLYSLSATSEFGFEFLPTAWQDFDVAQFTKLVKIFIRMEAGSLGYMPNSMPLTANHNTSDFVDWREFLVFCIFLGSNSPHTSLPQPLPTNSTSLSASLSSPHTDNISAISTSLASSVPTIPLLTTLPLPLGSSAITPVSNFISPSPLSSSSSFSTPPTPSTSKSFSNEETTAAEASDAHISTDILADTSDRQSELGPTQAHRVSFLGNFAAPLPPNMAQLAEMKAAFRGVDTDNDGKVTFAEFLRVPMWFEVVTSEFSDPKYSDVDTVSHFVQKLKRAIFHVFRQPPMQAEEINNNQGVMNKEPFGYFEQKRTFYGTPKVDYMELLSYFCMDWNEGEGIRKAVWISGDSPGHPLELQKLVFLLHTQYSSSLQNEHARNLLYTIAGETHMSVADTATIEQLLAVPHGRTLVERAYDRFTLENVRPILRLPNATTAAAPVIIPSSDIDTFIPRTSSRLKNSR